MMTSSFIRQLDLSPGDGGESEWECRKSGDKFRSHYGVGSHYLQKCSDGFCRVSSVPLQTPLGRLLRPPTILHNL